MPYGKSLRFCWLAPSVIITALALSACETVPASPPAPISTGKPRMEPNVPPPAPTDPRDADGVGEGETEPGFEAPQDDVLVPPHMAGRDIRRVGVLLPFSHPNRAVRTEAQGLFAAIELALFEHGGEDILLMPKDTRGDARTAGVVAGDALREGADVIIGPLFGNNVRSVSSLASARDVAVVAFSNDRSVAGGGAYLLSISPEEEVARVVDWAALRGVSRFALLGPDTSYGRRVEAALRYEAARRGGIVLGAEFYSPSNDAPVDEAKRLSERIQLESEPVAVIVPEQGVKLRSVAPLLPYYGVDLRKVQMMGTGLWNDPSVWREPTLDNGVFAAPDPEDLAAFERAYEATYGSKPTDLASLGYDAAALVVRLLGQDGDVTRRELENPDGYIGANGLFRFRLDGTVERGLAVVAIRQGQTDVVDPGRDSYDPGGS